MNPNRHPNQHRPNQEPYHTPVDLLFCSTATYKVTKNYHQNHVHVLGMSESYEAV